MKRYSFMYTCSCWTNLSCSTIVSCATIVLCWLIAAPVFAGPASIASFDHIVNGVTTTDHPSTVALVDADSGRQFCTGTLIGCQTVLTAAHCVCEANGSGCGQGAAALLNPSQVRVFAQHQGLSNVALIRVHPEYQFRVESDVAILTLAEAVNGIAPTPINDQLNPSPGQPGTLVGFGLTDGDQNDAGLKRQGDIVTSACTEVPAAPHLCWSFNNPLGAPGDDSNTCSGDSGGPLLMNFGAGTVVAGVTSGGANASCRPADEGFDANVFYDRTWIRQQAGADLANTSCGSLPQAGQAEAPYFSTESSLDAATPQARFSLPIPAGTSRLRVTLNSEEGSAITPNDYDLFLRHAQPATTSTFNCASQLAGGYEVCEILAPEPGTWHVLVDRFTGAGNFQVTATIFSDNGTGSSSCTPDSTTLCLADRRFSIEVDYQTAIGGGSSGSGQSIPLSPLGIGAGGLFWFFDITNPELLIKVLNGCNINGNYWVFWSAGTTVGLELRVTDEATGRTVVYTSPDGETARPVTDTGAFTCDGS